MACPNCRCRTTYQFDDSDQHNPMADDRLERCAACGAIFDIDDHIPEDDDALG